MDIYSVYDTLLPIQMVITTLWHRRPMSTDAYQIRCLQYMMGGDA